MIVNKTKKHFSRKVTKRKQYGGKARNYLHKLGLAKSRKTPFEKALEVSKRRQKLNKRTNEELKSAKMLAGVKNVASIPLRLWGSVVTGQAGVAKAAYDAEFSLITTPVSLATTN